MKMDRRILICLYSEKGKKFGLIDLLGGTITAVGKFTSMRTKAISQLLFLFIYVFSQLFNQQTYFENIS